MRGPLQGLSKGGYLMRDYLKVPFKFLLVPRPVRELEAAPLESRSPKQFCPPPRPERLKMAQKWPFLGQKWSKSAKNFPPFLARTGLGSAWTRRLEAYKFLVYLDFCRTKEVYYQKYRWFTDKNEAETTRTLDVNVLFWLDCMFPH